MKKTVDGVIADHDLVQRLILPIEDDTSIWPLYVDRGHSPSSAVGRYNLKPKDRAELVRNHLGMRVSRTSLRASLTDVGRHEATVVAHERIAFSGYFNAFPAAYWQQWTPARTVRLQVVVSAPGIVEVHRSNSRGVSTRVAGGRVEAGTHEFEMKLDRYGDGGWLWLEVESEDVPVRVESAGWFVPSSTRRLDHKSHVTVAITTYNLPQECLEQMRRFGGDSAVLDRIAEVIFVDQGTNKVCDAEGYAEASAALGKKHRVIEQANLGGSGGFSRGMYEMLKNPDSDYVLLFDDDALAEPESVLRAIDFADHTSGPTLVGGNMFNLHERTLLQSPGEVINWKAFTWRAAEFSHYFQGTGHGSIDLAVHTIRDTPALSRRIDVDYNGWWMCLIPREVVEEIGLGLPVFIKWDDVEYGIRAGEHGFPTVSVPGVAVWHAPWVEKEDSLDWQAYFHQRNRWVAALLHSDSPRGKSVAASSFKTDMKHLLNMQYVAAKLRLMGLEDALQGPEHLHRTIHHRAADARNLIKTMPEGKLYTDPAEFPTRADGTRVRTSWDHFPENIFDYGVKAIQIGIGRVRRLGRTIPTEPTDRIPSQQAGWWRLIGLDSALVGNAEGSGVWWYRRQPKVFREGVAKNIELYTEMMRRWDDLSAQYREALPQFTSPEEWEKTFGIGQD